MEIAKKKKEDEKKKKKEDDMKLEIKMQEIIQKENQDSNKGPDHLKKLSKSKMKDIQGTDYEDQPNIENNQPISNPNSTVNNQNSIDKVENIETTPSPNQNQSQHQKLTHTPNSQNLLISDQTIEQSQISYNIPHNNYSRPMTGVNNQSNLSFNSHPNMSPQP